MFITQAGSDRGQLGFAEAVTLNFAFLGKYGFKPVQAEVTLLRYQSDEVAVSIYHGRSSYEIGIEFERLGAPGEHFNLYAMLRWARETGRIDEIPTAGYQASSREAVQALVAKIAELVKKYAEPLLKGDLETYLYIKKQQSSDAEKYTNQIKLRSLRRQAEDAWTNKDYATYLSLYADMRGDLTPAEFMRFQYAEKQLTAPSNMGRETLKQK